MKIVIMAELEKPYGVSTKRLKSAVLEGVRRISVDRISEWRAAGHSDNVPQVPMHLYEDLLDRVPSPAATGMYLGATDGAVSLYISRAC